jgi:hypothetical protein
MSRTRRTPTPALRPYQLLCLVCALGETDAPPKDRKLKAILTRIRKNPDLPVALVCNAGDVFAYQDPGTADDTPEGREFNIKRDFDILYRLGLAPGSILPARILLRLLLHQITTVQGVCGYGAVTSAAWAGCAKANSQSYEKGRQKGISAIIPARPKAEMDAEKRKSMEALLTGKGITVRPHILLCAVCQYANGVRPPFADDNLPEFLELILTKQPDLPVTLARGADWMMCAPCPSRVPHLNACVCGLIGSGGLYNEMKDLNVLQQLGLTYGTTMRARDLFRLIFARIPKALGVCALQGEHLPDYSVWRDGCGRTAGPHGYDKGREMLLDKIGP